MFDGKPVAVLYNYKSPGAANPTDLDSPSQKTRVDILKTLEDAKIVIERKPDSYSLRVSVPLETLGFKPEPGKTYLGDFGIIYSDQAGIVNEARMNWSNKATNLVSDLGLEAAIHPESWGKFNIEAK